MKGKSRVKAKEQQAMWSMTLQQTSSTSSLQYKQASKLKSPNHDRRLESGPKNVIKPQKESFEDSKVQILFKSPRLQQHFIIGHIETKIPLFKDEVRISLSLMEFIPRLRYH